MHRDPRSGALRSQTLGGHSTPPIAIQPEGSTTAAAWALLTRAPVVVMSESPGDAAVLDLQLIRQAGAEGLAAIPIGAGEPGGVLLVFGSRQALSAIAANPRHYARLGELAGRPAPQPLSAAPVTGNNDQLAVKVRRAAHEINNPLGIVKNYLAIMKAKLGDEASIGDELRIMHEELDRIVRIIRGLTQDEAPLGPFLEEADVNALIEDLVKVTDPSWQSKGVRIVQHLDANLPRLACDRDKLKQIVLNLLLNALEATPAGGQVRLETGSLVNHRQERFVEISVADSGPGIPRELAGRVFSPVESAKGEGHAGLGLSIVKALTQSLNGSITFKSNATGTTFQILLPTN
jgi:signal transduction histidine kinase